MAPVGESDKRQKILKAAVRVFSQKGFHDAKVDEIAQLADVGKGTVYEYFSSKGELFQEMFRAGMQFYLNHLQRELKPGLSSQEKLTRIARVHMKFVDQYKDLARITMTEHAFFNEEFRKWIWENRSRKIEQIKQIIDEGIASGEFRQVDSQAAAQAFIGILGAMFPVIIFSKTKGTYKGLIEQMTDIIFNGLVKPT